MSVKVSTRLGDSERQVRAWSVLLAASLLSSFTFLVPASPHLMFVFHASCIGDGRRLWTTLLLAKRLKGTIERRRTIGCNQRMLWETIWVLPKYHNMYPSKLSVLLYATEYHLLISQILLRIPSPGPPRWGLLGPNTRSRHPRRPYSPSRHSPVFGTSQLPRPSSSPHPASCHPSCE